MYAIYIYIYIYPYNNAIFYRVTSFKKGFPAGSDNKESACNAGDLGSVPGSGRSREDNSNPLQYSCLENPMNRGYSPWVSKNCHDQVTKH